MTFNLNKIFFLNDDIVRIPHHNQRNGKSKLFRISIHLSYNIDCFILLILNMWRGGMVELGRGYAQMIVDGRCVGVEVEGRVGKEYRREAGRMGKLTLHWSPPPPPLRV